MIAGRRTAALALAAATLLAAPVSANHVGFSVSYQGSGAAVCFKPKASSNCVVTRIWTYPNFTRGNVRVVSTPTGKAVRLYPIKNKNYVGNISIAVKYDAKKIVWKNGRKTVKKVRNQNETVTMQVKTAQRIFGNQAKIIGVSRR